MTEQTDVMHTSGPWPIDFTGDGKRIVVGAGLVEGPNGYDVAEVYADDCPQEVAEANARLIAAAPDLLAALEDAAEVLHLLIPRFGPEGPETAAQQAEYETIGGSWSVATRAIARARGQ